MDKKELTKRKLKNQICDNCLYYRRSKNPGSILEFCSNLSQRRTSSEDISLERTCERFAEIPEMKINSSSVKVPARKLNITYSQETLRELEKYCGDGGASSEFFNIAKEVIVQEEKKIEEQKRDNKESSKKSNM